MTDWAAWRREVNLDEYEQRWAQLAAAGEAVHGEADFVCRYRPATVLDAGCGMGRVAIELARRGIAVVGVDLDTDLLDRARRNAPDLQWVHASLVGLDLGRHFDVVVMAGNVIPFVAAPERAAAVAGCAAHLAPGGRLVTGFSLLEGWPDLAAYDRWCAGAGLVLAERFATWNGDPFDRAAGYAVSVHVQPAQAARPAS